MTLRCQCGGAVTIQDGSDPDGGPPFVEFYQCESCGGTGTYTFSPDSETMSGCLTSVSTGGWA